MSRRHVFSLPARQDDHGHCTECDRGHQSLCAHTIPSAVDVSRQSGGIDATPLQPEPGRASVVQVEVLVAGVVTGGGVGTDEGALGIGRPGVVCTQVTHL